LRDGDEDIPRGQHIFRYVRSHIDPVAQLRLPLAPIAAPIANFDGLGDGFSGPGGSFTVGAHPPDTTGDVGPQHFVQAVNSGATTFAVFKKDGTTVLGPTDMSTLFMGVGDPCQTSTDGDPVVKYDRIADRWIISQFGLNVPNNQ